jgi:hypothetical protein
MFLYSAVYWVAAAKCGLWVNGIKQELALQETDRLHVFGLEKEFRKLKDLIAVKYGIYRTLQL